MSNVRIFVNVINLQCSEALTELWFGIWQTRNTRIFDSPWCRIQSRTLISCVHLPSKSTISSNCSISVLPGSKGLFASNSPRIQPAAHISSAGVCRGDCKSSSGALYHRVTTRGVALRAGAPSQRARPKSAAKEQHNLLVIIKDIKEKRSLIPVALQNKYVSTIYHTDHLPILTHPLSVRSKLETFRSLCTMKFEWRYLRPFSTCSIKHLTWDSVNGDVILSSNDAKSCSQYSIERNMLKKRFHYNFWKIGNISLFYTKQWQFYKMACIKNNHTCPVRESKLQAVTN